MPDESDQPLTPEQESRIRHALASARATDPTPDQVAARLDATLADLVADRGAKPGEQASRTGHRRRWVLVAAAASVAAVAALNLPSLRQHGSDLTSAGGSSDSAATQSLPKGSRSGANTPRSGAAGLGREADGPVRLSSGSFRTDVRRLLAGDDTLALTRSPGSTPSPADGVAVPCATGTPPPGITRQQVVLLDGEPALLEVFGTRAGTRLVRAVTCAGAETLASTLLPAH